MSTDAPLPAEVGRYRVVRSLGHGAMGRVLLARDPVLDRDVAIKLLRQDLALGPGQEGALLDRMRQEARASARVLHPNIVALFDMGEDPELGLYLVFEYVEGPTLKDEIDAGPLGPTRAARIAREVGGALATAHAAGVLHRDIKPENVILAKSGAKVADFGIARIPGSTLTRDGGVLGTPAYSSPEAIETGEFSPASDQFSFATTMYEALSGRRAFPGDDAVTVARHITSDDPEPIAARLGLDPHVDDVLARGMAKSPGRRYAGADEFGAALHEALGVTAARAALPTLPDERHREAESDVSERRQLVAAAIGAVVGASLVAAGVLLWPSPPAAPSQEALGSTGDAAARGPAPVADPIDPARPKPREPQRRPEVGTGRANAAPVGADATATGDGAPPPQDAAAPRLDAARD